MKIVKKVAATLMAATLFLGVGVALESPASADSSWGKGGRAIP